MAKPLTITVSKKKVFLAATIAATVGFSGVIVSGAYFTDEVNQAANSVTAATVYLGSIGATDNTPISITNILPSAGGAAANVSTVNVKNIGTASFDWQAQISLPSTATADQKAFAGQLNFSYSTNGGTSWSTPATTLATSGGVLSPIVISSTTPLASGTVATPTTQAIQFRIWLPATTLNTYQGKSLTFDARVRAIQVGQSLTTDANFAPTNAVPVK